MKCKWVALLAVVFAPMAANAAIVFTKADRLMGTAVNHEYIDPEWAGFDHASSEQLGTFSKSSTTQLPHDVGDGSGITASQNSTIGNGSIVTHGDIVAIAGDDLVWYNSVLNASFCVLSPTKYSLQSHFSFQDFWQPGFIHPFMTLRIVDVSRSIVLSEDAFDDDFATVTPTKIERSGVLQPGDYRLEFNMRDGITMADDMGTTI